MPYAGLTPADKGALLEAKSNGYRTTHLWSNGLRYLVNIDVALYQIAEMEEAEKPLTWNERINHMTVEEKIEAIRTDLWCDSRQCHESGCCFTCMAEFLRSPYTEGGHR